MKTTSLKGNTMFKALNKEDIIPLQDIAKKVCPSKANELSDIAKRYISYSEHNGLYHAADIRIAYVDYSGCYHEASCRDVMKRSNTSSDWTVNIRTVNDVSEKCYASTDPRTKEIVFNKHVINADEAVVFPEGSYRKVILKTGSNLGTSITALSIEDVMFHGVKMLKVETPVGPFIVNPSEVAGVEY